MDSEELQVDPLPDDLEQFVPYACRKLGAPFTVSVLTRTQEEYVSRLDTPKKPAKRGTSRQPSETAKVEESSGGTPDAFRDEHEVPLVLVLDSAERVVELAVERARVVPCMLLKLLALCAPWQPQLAAVRVRHAALAAPALHELAALCGARLTQLCLDDARLPRRAGALLLAAASRLAHLSLARTGVDDEDCAALCAVLAFPRPASGTLRTLSLGSNDVSDAGALAVADMLRANRTLLYLDLSGNRITDGGALLILGVLREFPLTPEEVVAKRARMLSYLRARQELYERCLREATMEKSAVELGRGKSARRAAAGPRAGRASAGSSADGAAARADAMTDELLGAFSDPFGDGETVVRGGAVHCVGNTALCALNLAYNELQYASVAELLRVLRRQRAGAGGGLLRVLLDGNALPATCPEYDAIRELLEALYREKELAAARGAKRFDRNRLKSKH